MTPAKTTNQAYLAALWDVYNLSTAPSDKKQALTVSTIAAAHHISSLFSTSLFRMKIIEGRGINIRWIGTGPNASPSIELANKIRLDGDSMTSAYRDARKKAAEPMIEKKHHMKKDKRERSGTKNGAGDMNAVPKDKRHDIGRQLIMDDLNKPEPFTQKKVHKVLMTPEFYRMFTVISTLMEAAHKLQIPESQQEKFSLEVMPIVAKYTTK